jgi:glycosyltransferase A (GT-A) superfamily protein (DUF2064 family)
MPDERSPHVLVLAKAPVPGRVKTRLQAACTPEAAAAVAAAAIDDTLAAVARCRAARRVLALDGAHAAGPDGAGPALSARAAAAGFHVVDQVPGPFARRLAGAWSVAGAPGLQIGMDTPQVTAAALDDALDRLAHRSVDAVLGPAADGGWWALGLAAVPADGMAALFDGIEMSRDDTGAQQLRRLRDLGLRTALLDELRDIDEPDDLRAVAADHPDLATARAARSLGLAPAGAGR